MPTLAPITKYARFAAALAIALLVITLPEHGTAATPALIPASALTGVTTIATTNGGPPVFVATDVGLYRSASADYRWWTPLSASSGIYLLSVNPHDPKSLVYQTRDGAFHSGDGGRTATRIARPCNFQSIARSPSLPTTLYATTQILCGPPVYGDLSAQVLRSTDDGLTWTAVYTGGLGGKCTQALDTVAVDPSDPLHVRAGVACPGGDVLDSRDGGATWHELRESPFAYGRPGMLLFNPARPREFWVAWVSNLPYAGLEHSPDGGRTWQTDAVYSLPRPYVMDMAADPLNGRIYLAMVQLIDSSPPSDNLALLYATDGQGAFERIAPGLMVTLPAIGGAPGYYMGAYPLLAITRDGYLLTWDAASNLVVRRINSGGTWTPSSIYDGPLRDLAAQLLGQPLSPTRRCAGLPCQYFIRVRWP